MQIDRELERSEQVRTRFFSRFATGGVREYDFAVDWIGAAVVDFPWFVEDDLCYECSDGHGYCCCRDVLAFKGAEECKM